MVMMKIGSGCSGRSRSGSRLQMRRKHGHAQWWEEIGWIERLLETVNKRIVMMAQTGQSVMV